MAENRSLRAENETLATRPTADALAALEDDLAALRPRAAEAETLRDTVAALEDDLADAQAALSDAEAEGVADDRRIAALNDQIAALRPERERLSAEHDAARSALEPLETAPTRDAATQIDPPPPDCTTEDGTDGYRFPGPGCVPVTAWQLGGFSSDPEEAHLSEDFSDADLRKVAGMPDLLRLVLSGTQVSDLAPLSSLTALEELFLRGTRVSELSPLSGLTALEWLALERTPVSDLAPLSSLSGLEWLTLRGTQVSDLGPLSGLPRLRWIGLPDGEWIGGPEFTDENRRAVQDWLDAEMP
jgi:hypothetical protein